MFSLGVGQRRSQHVECRLRASDLPAARRLHSLRGRVSKEPQRYVDYEAHRAIAGQGDFPDQQAGADQEVEYAESLGTTGDDGRTTQRGLCHLQIRGKPFAHR